MALMAGADRVSQWRVWRRRGQEKGGGGGAGALLLPPLPLALFLEGSIGLVVVDKQGEEEWVVGHSIHRSPYGLRPCLGCGAALL